MVKTSQVAIHIQTLKVMLGCVQEAKKIQAKRKKQNMGD